MKTIFQEFNTPKWYDSLYRKLLSNMVQIITPIAVACRSDAASHSSWLSHCFWLLTFPPHRPYLLSFRSPWAVWCMALLKRLFLPRVVLISNKRGCGTRGGRRAGTATLFFFRCRELHGPVLRPFRLHSSSSPCFSIRTEASRVHRSSRVSIATPGFFSFFFFYLTHMAALLTLILRSRYQGTIHSLAWGRWQKCLCFPFCVHEREKRERKAGGRDAISGEREMTGPVI